MPPRVRDPINKKNEFLLRTTFTIIKNVSTAKRKGTKTMSESKRFTANREETKRARQNKIIGRSKIVLRILTARPISILRAKITSAIRTTAVVKICLGSAKKSVVRVTKRIGRLISRRNNKTIEMLFR
jgi:hypothetical protein